MNVIKKNIAPQDHAFALQCPTCGKLFYPSVLICDVCHTRRDPRSHVSAWKEEPLEGYCTLLSWTRVYALPEGYATPYLDFCIVEFPNGLRACGQLEADKPELGMQLEGYIAVVSKRLGAVDYGFIFASPEFD
jgi:uncharacterized OB-fold protein